MENTQKTDTVNSRVMNLLKKRVNYLFKCVLADIEYETKSYNIDPKFFTTKYKGFLKIRKSLFEHGNAIIETMDLILNQVEITPTKSIVYFKEDTVEDGS